MQALGEQSVQAAKELAEAPVDVMILGCTSGSFVNGPEYNRKIIKQMEEVSGVPCTTTASAIVAALKYLDVKNIAVVTPYIDEVNQRAKKFFEKEGFIVTSIKGMGLLHDSEIDRQSTEKVYRFAKSNDHQDAQAMLLLCTGLRTIPIIETLEKDLGKPVISAIQASFWHCLQLAGINEKIEGYGMLFE